MIRITIEKNKIVAKGHADYADEGHDIVCASFTTAITITLNTIEALGKITYIDSKVESGNAVITVLKEDDDVRKILNVLILALKDLEIIYPNNINIIEK